jgi:GNAT superfamily N-acetyltransferase
MKRMIVREASVADVKQIQLVRNAVKENVLSNPDLVTDRDCIEYLTQKGKGWVCEAVPDIVVGFAIADLVGNNVWALFVHPDFEGRGIGKRLHDTMINWYFCQQRDNIWLSTSPHTRAEKFYRMQGWKEVGTYGKGEIKFERSRADWTGGSRNENAEPGSTR